MKGLVLVPFGISLGAVVACASVADLDVKYNPDAVSTDAGSSGGGDDAAPTGDGGGLTPRAEAPPRRDPDAGDDPIVSSCACDELTVKFCCAAQSGAFCTDDQTACEAQTGTFLRCTGPNEEGDPCCLARHPTGAETALAGRCAEGHPVVCSADRDCPNGGTCTLGACPGGITVGTCDGTPVCPAP